jgi:activator of HSP90 ATPase
MQSNALSRRSVWGFAIALGAVAGSSLFARSRDASAGEQNLDDLGISTSSASIHQEVVFEASPARLYEALTDAEIFQRVVVLSGAIQSMASQSLPARISREPGGDFALFGGYITGRQIELTPATRIVQVWRSAGWKPHLYSIARFEISEHPDGAKLVFDHVGFPSDDAQGLATGWRQHYWAPLAKLLAS